MIFLPGGGTLEVMGGSVHIKENVRGCQGKRGRWRGREDTIGGRCVLDLIKVRMLSSSIHKSPLERYHH